MPIIPPIPDADAGEAARPAFDLLRSRVGAVPSMYRTLAHAPAVLDAVTAMGQAIRSGLDPKLRELAYLKTARLAGGVRVVIGTSGLTAADYADIERAAAERGLGVVAAGNFSVTAPARPGEQPSPARRSTRSACPGSCWRSRRSWGCPTSD